jgi:predicted RNase H-like HicB family nuclease
MAAQFVLTEYVTQAMADAVYDKLDDGSFAGRIPVCTGVVVFGATLRGCEEELRSVLEDWVLVGLKLGHPLPVIAGIDEYSVPLHWRTALCWSRTTHGILKTSRVSRSKTGWRDLSARH